MMTKPPPLPGSGLDSSRGGERRQEPKGLRAWILLNVVAFPGLGTVLAGRREGYFQASLMVVGFVVVVVGFYRWGQYQVGVLFQNRPESDGPSLMPFFWGLGCSFLAWLWACWTSWKLWQEFKGETGARKDHENIEKK